MATFPLTDGGLLIFAHQMGTPAFYWAVVADLSLVLWTVLLMLAPRWSGSDIGGWRFRLAGFGAAVLASLVTLAGKTLEVWPGNPLFPSGHTAYSVAIAVFLVGGDRRRLAWAVPLLCLLAVALVLARYHVPVDIAGGAAVGLAVGAASFRLARGPLRARPVHQPQRPE